MRITHYFTIFILQLILITDNPVLAMTGNNNTVDVKSYTYSVINTYPHDTAAFTQGLLFHDGFLYESTGLFKQSTLREVKLETGEVTRQRKLDSKHFGEGLALVNNQLYQLTWTSTHGFIFDLDTFEYIKPLSYLYRSQTENHKRQPWGLTYNGTHLILSDGSATLYFIDPVTHKEHHKILVKSRNKPITMLNELEFINGEIYSNVWKTNNIVRINPKTGKITGIIDLTQLYPENLRPHSENVLNGIAYDKQNHRLFVTGKHWPTLYEIAIIETANNI